MEIEPRVINKNDYNLKFMDLINTFTRNSKGHSFETFEKYLDIIQKQQSEIFVVEMDNIIVSSVKIFIEQKLHNNFSSVGHIEDLVTHTDYRKKGLASKLLRFAIEECKKKGVYKVVLATNEENLDFYLKNGFSKKGSECCIYIN